ncbi:MAG: Rrf2 family transcriptional regulator [Thermoguttaceae bacterium]|nr:Rrf2 family transcriptional regulator [Thermoguttaceae bacterium]
MKISTRGRYGVRILLDLALHEQDSPRMIREIAVSQKISEKYISRLIIELRRAGLVQSVRGSRGGYRLARQPSDLTLLEVIETMEGPIHLVECLTTPEYCQQADDCVARVVWDLVNHDIRQKLASITLQDLLGRISQKQAIYLSCDK